MSSIPGDALHGLWRAIGVNGGFRSTARSSERLEPFVGREPREVALLEWRPSSRHDVADGTLAVEFVFDTGRLHIANALDENSIEVSEVHPDFVRHGLDLRTGARSPYGQRNRGAARRALTTRGLAAGRDHIRRSADMMPAPSPTDAPPARIHLNRGWL